MVLKKVNRLLAMTIYSEILLVLFVKLFFRMKNLALLSFAIVVLFAACKQPKDLVYQNVQHFRVQTANLKQSTVAVDVRFYNPNNYNLKLKHADLDVYINGTHVGKLLENEHYTIPKLDTFLLPVVLQVDMQTVLPNALQLLFNSDVDIKLVGQVKAGRHGVILSIPVNYEGKQEIFGK